MMTMVGSGNIPVPGELIWLKNWKISGLSNWEIVLWLRTHGDPNNRYGVIMKSSGEIKDTVFMGNLYRGDKPSDA